MYRYVEEGKDKCAVYAYLTHIPSPLIYYTYKYLYSSVIINVIFEFMVEMILHTPPNTFKNIGYRSW